MFRVIVCLLLTKKGKQVANTEHVVFFGLKDKKIALMTEKGIDLTLGNYETEQEAAEMFVALCRAIEQGKNLFRMYKTGNEETVTDETAKHSKFTY